MIKTLKLKLYPTPNQIERIEYLFQARQWIWNYFVGKNNDIIKRNETINSNRHVVANKYNNLTPILGAYDINREIIKIRMEHSEIKNCLVNILIKTANDIEDMYNRYYKYNTKLPKDNNCKNTFTISVSDTKPMAHRAYFVNSKHKMYLSGIVSKNKLFKTLLKDPLEGIKYGGYVNKKEIKELKEVTVKKDKLSHYYAYVVYEVKEDYIKIKKVKGNKSIGIDLGIKKFLTDSKGNKVISPDYDKLRKRINRLDSIQDKLQDNSKQHRIDRLWAKIRNKRKGFLHNLSSYYTSIYKNIYIEDLNVKEMLRTNKLVPNDYKTKMINKKLNKNISNQGWRMFIHMLKYKSLLYNNNIIEIDPADTSRTCYICKHVDKNSRHGELFQCTKCGYINDADVNAAKNILEKGKLYIYTSKR